MFSSKFNFFNKKVIVSSFTPTAVLLISGTSYTIPTGATSMKAWAIGQGGDGSYPYVGAGGAGGTAYKTWSVSGGSTVTYTVGASTTKGASGANSTVTYGGVTITGFGGTGNNTGNPKPGGAYSGGDGGANGGNGTSASSAGLAAYTGRDWVGGSVGGNGTLKSCIRRQAVDVSGLFAALTLAGINSTESCGATAAFGSGGYKDYKYGTLVTAGIGAGNPEGGSWLTGGVVLYFT
jgi:hypothetical protein